MDKTIRTSASRMDSLPKPEMFQAPHNVLDLQNINPEDPVVVSIYLSNALKGEQVTVYFGENNKVIYGIKDKNQIIFDVTFSKENLPADGSFYEVWYVFREQKSSKLKINLIDSSKDFLRANFYSSSFYGTYLGGVLGAWIVASPYRLAQDAAVIRSIGSRADASPLTLDISRKGGKIGNISYSDGKWNTYLDQDVDLAKGDLLSIQMSVPASFLNFTISL